MILFATTSVEIFTTQITYLRITSKQVVYFLINFEKEGFFEDFCNEAGNDLRELKRV